MSTTVLPELDLKRPTIVWLDYDDQRARSMANALEIVGRTVADGSLVAATFAASSPTDGPKRQAGMDRLRSDFPEYVSHSASHPL